MANILFLVATPAPYSLQDLADQTGIEPRTIRSYIERGLLPGPDSRGRNAEYSREHLDRLKVLTLVRDAYRSIPLDRVRQLLQRLSALQIQEMAEGRLAIGDVLDTDERRQKSSALSYLSELRREAEGGGIDSKAARGDAGAAASMPREVGPHAETRRVRAQKVEISKEIRLRYGMSTEPARPASASPVEQLLTALAEIIGPQSVSRAATSQAWHRITITPDIEMSVRDSFTAEQIVQFQRVADALRILLTKGVRK